jgi:hypothetical protein
MMRWQHLALDGSGLISMQYAPESSFSLYAGTPLSADIPVPVKNTGFLHFERSAASMSNPVCMVPLASCRTFPELFFPDLRRTLGRVPHLFHSGSVVRTKRATASEAHATKTEPTH